jgi:hypothetical protein
MATDPTSVTVIAGTRDENRQDGPAADQHAQCKAERKNIECPRFRNALCDQVPRQPVPHPNLAGNVKKNKESDQKQQRTSEHRCRFR